jgi:hypothetical protein
VIFLALLRLAWLLLLSMVLFGSRAAGGITFFCCCKECDQRKQLLLWGVYAGPLPSLFNAALGLLCGLAFFCAMRFFCLWFYSVAASPAGGSLSLLLQRK